MKQSHTNKMVREVIILEGTSATGKTSSSNSISCDFTYYCGRHPMLVNKNEDSIHSDLYNNKLFTDTIVFLKRANKNPDGEDLVVDRSIFSSLLYNILFKFKGFNEDPLVFKKVVNEFMHADMCKLIYQNYNILWTLLLEAAPLLKISLLWIDPLNVEKVVEQLHTRNGFEVTNGYNLKNYVLNQKFLFIKFQHILEIGVIVEVDSYYISKPSAKNIST